MNITVYLPEDLGQEAKRQDLPLSRLLRHGVQRELRRREAQKTHRETMLAAHADAMKPVTLEVDDPDGEDYLARFVGAEVSDFGPYLVYLHEDGRVVVYDREERRLELVEDPIEELRDLPGFDEDSFGLYRTVIKDLGLRPVIDI